MICAQESQDNAEIKFIDQLLEGYAGWTRTHGINQQPIPAARLLRIPLLLEPHRGLALTNEQFMLVDRRRSQLPRRLDQILQVEYFEGDEDAPKWQRFGLTRLAYRQRLHAAQWALYTLLSPEVDFWRQGSL